MNILWKYSLFLFECSGAFAIFVVYNSGTSSVKCVDSFTPVARTHINQTMMDYSLNKRKVNIGPKKGEEVYVASAVCQKHRISFDELCERMADDSTVGQADIAAVFYRFRKVLNEYCSKGYIVDSGPLGTFRPTFTSKAVSKEEDFKPAECISKTQILFTPAPDFRRLKNVEFFRVAKQEKAKSKKNGGSGQGSSTTTPKS